MTDYVIGAYIMFFVSIILSICSMATLNLSVGILKEIRLLSETKGDLEAASQQDILAGKE